MVNPIWNAAQATPVTNPFDFSLKWGNGGVPVGQAAQLPFASTDYSAPIVDQIANNPLVTTQISEPVAPVDTGGDFNISLVNNSSNDSALGGPYGGLGFGPDGGVTMGTGNAPNTLLNVPVIGQTGTREDRQVGETSWDGTYEDVIDVRNEIAADPDHKYNSLLPPPAPPPGSPNTGHVEAAQEKYKEVLADPDIPNDVKAALNPAFNPEIAEAHQNKSVGVGNPDWGLGLIGTTKKAKNVLSEDAHNVLSQDIARNADLAEQGGHQSALGAATMLAAGVSNVGGKYNQSGDNAGLPDDFLIVGSSDGSQEVWGPNGQVYNSIEEAKSDVPNVGAQAAANVAKAGGQLHDVRKVATASGLSPKQAALIYEQNKGETGSERREQAERNRIAAEKKAAEQAAAAKRQAHLDSLSKEDAALYVVDEALQGKAGTKEAIYAARNAGLNVAGGSLRKKSNSELSRILEDIKKNNASAPPPPPQPVAQPAPQQAVEQRRAQQIAAQQEASRVAELTRVREENLRQQQAAAAQQKANAQEAATKEQAAAALASGNAGDMKTAIYAARKAGLVPNSGSLRKKSNSELKRILNQLNMNEGGYVNPLIAR